jgi:hypothetical protein
VLAGALSRLQGRLGSLGDVSGDDDQGRAFAAGLPAQGRAAGACAATDGEWAGGHGRRRSAHGRPLRGIGQRQPVEGRSAVLDYNRKIIELKGEGNSHCVLALTDNDVLSVTI